MKRENLVRKEVVPLDQMQPKKLHTRPGTRIIAGIVAAALMLSLVANGIVAVRIQAAEDSEAATNYLVDNTQYVNADTMDRLQDKFQNLAEPETLEDYYRIAGIQIAEEDYAGALSSIEQCIAMDDGSNYELHQDLLMKKGCLLVLLNRYDEAIAPLDLVLQTAPDTTDALLVKAQIYAAQQDIRNLVATLERYLEIESDNLEIRLLLAQAMFTIEDYEGARRQYQKILQTQTELPNISEYHYLYGLTCIQLGDFTDAYDHLLLALDSGNIYEGIHYYIGLCCMSNGMYVEAVSYFTTSIDDETMLQLSHYSRGISALMIEDYDAEVLLEDLAFAAEYSGSDADETISSQAALLTQQLTEGVEEIE